MKKILEYIFAGYCVLNSTICYATEKFEILPDLPDSLALSGSANAATITGSTSLTGAQAIGHEPSLISVVLSLLFVVLLIYLTGILYTKLNKVGFKTLKKQQGELAKSQVAVISTTALGNNKTLHVVELDGKRMLIGASSGAIQLIKDLGCVSTEGEEEEYSRIEIPNIKIPKIEIPKIEIPSIGFSKIMTKIHKDNFRDENTLSKEAQEAASEEITETEEQKNPEEVIDSLFKQDHPAEETSVPENNITEHVVDPDEFALYKKYLG